MLALAYKRIWIALFIMRLFMGRFLFPFFTSVILLLGVHACQSSAHHLSLIPEELEVQEVIYAEEEAWGIGPGANETGVIVYHLPNKSAERIEEIGVEYFAITNRNWEWKVTPIEAEWATNPDPESPTFNPNASVVMNYLNRYGFGISIDTEVETMLDQAISSPGSYYSQGRTGIVIVSLDLQRVFFIYSG